MTFAPATGGFRFTWTFHDADGRPRFLQGRSRGDTTAASTDYHEYWYDALGRRVLAREYADSIGGAGTLTRFAWDGDQMLRESRTGAGPFASGLDGTGTGAWHGTRRFTQTGAVDVPLVLWVNGDPRAVVRNWRGSAAGGIVVATNATDTLVYPAATYDVRLAPDARLGAPPPNAWLGSLIGEQADASGLLYRRNRYYDPGTGRFTQSDPIGLAGGMNLYSYADGDPVNNHDPNGTECERRGDKLSCKNFGSGDAETIRDFLGGSSGQRVYSWLRLDPRFQSENCSGGFDSGQCARLANTTSRLVNHSNTLCSELGTLFARTWQDGRVSYKAGSRAYGGAGFLFGGLGRIWLTEGTLGASDDFLQNSVAHESAHLKWPLTQLQHLRPKVKDDRVYRTGAACQR